MTETTENRIYPKARRGRPLIGDEPLDVEITVMITETMMVSIRSRLGYQGTLAEFVRAALEDKLTE